MSGMTEIVVHFDDAGSPVERINQWILHNGIITGISSRNGEAFCARIVKRNGIFITTKYGTHEIGEPSPAMGETPIEELCNIPG